MALAIKPDHKAIDDYYETLETLRVGQGIEHEQGLRRAFSHLLSETAKVRKWILIEEVTEKARRERKGGVRPDGVIRDQWQLIHGHWEAKDTDDDLEVEIRKKRDKGYPFDNIIFEDTRNAVLYQDGYRAAEIDMADRAGLADLLTRFYTHEIPAFKDFDEAVEHFKNEVPHIAGELKQRIDAAHADNRAFQSAFADFMELCRTALNPNISAAAVDEMLIQHMLTERIIRKVFDVERFTRINVIAAEVEKVIDSLTGQYFSRREFLGALDRFYEAIEDAADKLADFSDKQRFINTVYERFFQGYSVKVADTHGIVYTPQEIVDFMCAAVEEVLENEFGAKLGDEDVYVLDPATGTGSFIVNLLRRAHERNPRDFERFYRQQLFANEVLLMPYYIASLNIEHEYYDLTGRYEPFEGVCFVDTLDLAEGPQMKLAFMTEKNAERVERQQNAPITVIIGNPPYNIGQVNENDNNKNRKYEVVDGRVKESYVADSNATLRTQLYDPYVKFFRWATDRLGKHDGVVCFITNNSFVDQIAFDGMREHLMRDFTRIYHLDLHGNVRQNPKLSGTTHNVFGIQVGVGITVAIRSSQHREDGLFYKRVPEFWRKEEKLAYLTKNVNLDGKQNSLNTIDWESLQPDEDHNWLLSEFHDEFAAYYLMSSKEVKASRGIDAKALFGTYGIGVKTNRDSIVHSFNSEELNQRIEQFCEDYNSEVDRYNRSGRIHDVDDFVDYTRIKWSSTLKRYLQGGRYAEFDASRTRLTLYRPYTASSLYYDHLLIDRPGFFQTVIPNSVIEPENAIICVSGIGSFKPFQSLVTNRIPGHDLLEKTQCFPFYVYDEDGGNRRENITDWALAQFRARYGPHPPAPSPTGRGGESDVGPSRGRGGEGGSRPVGGGGGEGGSRPVGGGGGASRMVESNPGRGGAGDVAGEGDEEAAYRAMASKVMVSVARELRQRQTPAEALLWACLRNRQLNNLKFRRQHPLEHTSYVVDFLCYEARLVVELDGGVHETQVEADAARQAAIEEQGYRVLRFHNDELFDDLETVLASIIAAGQSGVPLSEERSAAAAQSEVPLPEEGTAAAGQSGVPLPEDGSAAAAQAEVPLSEGEGFRVRALTKWDIFYYVYGLLHHPEYRERYADNLKRELPRIPFAPDFWAFAEAGRALADLHLNYETVAPYELDWEHDGPIDFRVEKMRPGKKVDSPDGPYKIFDTLVYNDTLTLRGIPAEAFAYRLGNRSALDWVIDQYRVKTDKRSGIVSDPNGYSDDERYIVDLVEKVIRVSLETVAIVSKLSELAFRDA